MSFISNIQSVSKYESKLLMRSWFFRVFAFLSILFLTVYSITICWGNNDWSLQALPSNIPYVNLLILNLFQAVSAIFLASDFLKRDKKLDTSEVFYVRPLSNAEYVLGKLWGNLCVFIFLNGVIIGISLFCTAISPRASIDWNAYLIYFVLISIPTLIFIIGLSVLLMSVLRNQAVTFILLLGYILLTIIYLQNKYYSLFDYMTYYLPLVKSSIVGFTNTEMLLNHRGFYLFVGLAFIFITITFFARLSNTPRSKYGWLAFSVVMLGIGGWSAYRHVRTITGESELRRQYTELNNKYVHTPKMIIDRYDISVEQQPRSFRSEVKMQGIALSPASVFTFCLNPGLTIQEVSGEAGQTLEYERDRQIVLIHFGKELAKGDTVGFTIQYSGRVDNTFCYLDIPDKLLQESYRVNMLSSDKQYCFQTPDYLMFTPETYWYPRPGTAYSSESPDWQQTYFSQFNLKVKPLPGLVPISQGEETENEDGSYVFIPEYPVQAITLVIGKYKRQGVETNGVRYELRFIEGHDYYATVFDSIRDTIPFLINEYKENTERAYRLEYPFKRFSVVEAPAQFCVYGHAWSLAKENVQPEMTFVSEKLWAGWRFNFEREVKNRKQWNQSMTDEDVQMGVLRDALQQIPLFPQFYNFRYNIFSSEWPVANRIVEYYLQDNTQGNGESLLVFEGGLTRDWTAGNGGMTNDEKANQLMEKQNFKDLLANDEYRVLSNSVTRLKAKQLFAPAELNTDVRAFCDSVYALLNRNTFRNVRFEQILDTLGALSQVDLRSTLTEWYQPALLPFYSIDKPDIIRYSYKGKDVYMLKVTVNNLSDNDGIVNIIIRLGNWQAQNDPRTNRNIWLEAHQGKQIVTFWDEAPRSVVCNTIISDNIPYTVEQPIDNIRQENREPAEKEGDYPVAESSSLLSEEVIVDNEDSLFFLSKEVVTGLLPKWLNNNADTAFHYSDLPSWRRAPIQWTATTNPGFYGKNIRSAYVVKSGSGNHLATWKVPVPSAGNYEVYYHVFKDQNQGRRNNRSGGKGAEYHFKIQYEGETEDAYLDLQRANNGWERLGAYYFGKDTVRITLTNESKERRVTADAVKIVKR